MKHWAVVLRQGNIHFESHPNIGSHNGAQLWVMDIDWLEKWYENTYGIGMEKYYKLMKKT